MSQWVRLWEDMPDDPKWRVIAKRSGRPLHEIIAVFTRMLVNAGRSSMRGTLEGWNDEDEAIALDMEEAQVSCIRNAMQGKVLDDMTLAGWEKRQPKREDGSTARVKAFRDRQSEMKRDETHRNTREDERRVETDLGEANASLVNGDAADANVVEVEFDRSKTEKRQALKAIGEWWNELAGSVSLSQIDAIRAGSSREKAAWARCREMLDADGDLTPTLTRAAAKIRGSPFLLGSTGWKADFDFFVTASKFEKLLEGSYDEDRQAQRTRK